MNKKLTIGLLGLAAVAAIAYSSSAYAYRGDGTQNGPNYSPERHEAMLKAFENKDYETWKNLMQGRGAAKVVTADNFARFTEMHNLMLQGKTDEAAKIRTELGLGQGQGRGMMGEGKGTNRGGRFVDNNGDGTCDNMR